MNEEESVDETINERTIDQLRSMLVQDAALPPGLGARLQAQVGRVRQRSRPLAWGERVVVGAMMFSVAGFGGTTWTLVSAGVVSALYASLAHRVMPRESWQSVRREPRNSV